MSTEISWTHYRTPDGKLVRGFFLNPIKGCSHAAFQPVEGGPKRAHPGCENCYAESFCTRNMHGEAATVGQWNGTLEFYPERISWPFTRSGMRPRRDGHPTIGFLCSESDMGHLNLDRDVEAFRYDGRKRISLGKLSGLEAWKAINGMMVLARHIIWKDFTKRPKVQRERLERFSPADCVETYYMMRFNRRPETDTATEYMFRAWSDFPHIHRYVSVSDQPTADALIPELLLIPSAFHGVSAEPLIGPVNIMRVLIQHRLGASTLQPSPRLSHVIIGGESGPGARPFDLAWGRSLIRQCRTMAVPPYLKQVGKAPFETAAKTRSLCGCRNVCMSPYDCAQSTERRLSLKLRNSKGADPSEWPEDLRVQEQPQLPGAL